MYKNGKIMIAESDRNRIMNLYGLQKKNENYVFDFVLTENNKYLIIMDELFVAGNNGKSLGSIWENTHIFNEIILESISKSTNTITESVYNQINTVLENVTWTKEKISEWIKTPNVINEGIWDSIKSGLSHIGGTMLKGLETVFKKGVVPFLRWIRRGIYTNVGIVIDVVVSILAVKTNAIVWFIICLLDIYEIVTGNFDPQDPDRKESPYLYLIGDLLSAVLTGGVGKVFNKSIPVIQKQGIKKVSPTIVRALQNLSKKIPSLKTQLKSAANTLSKKFKGDSAVSIILRSIDGVLSKLEQFLIKLFSKEGAKAVATGGVVLGAVKGVEHLFKGSDNKSQTPPPTNDNSGIDPDVIKTATDMGIFN